MKLNYPKEIYLYWVASFFFGISFVLTLVVPFFREWGGLSQFQTQILGSIYAIASILLEIPTGIFADLKGRKNSVLLGFFFIGLAPIILSAKPEFIFFVIGEISFALGFSFLSGALEALIYDLLRHKNKTEVFGKVTIIATNLNMAGLMFSAIISPVLLAKFSVPAVIRFEVVGQIVAFLIFLLFIKEYRFKEESEFVPDYKTVFVHSISTLKKNRVLRKLLFCYLAIFMVGYFVKWLYQGILLDMGIDSNEYGAYHTVLLLSGIAVGYFVVRLMSRIRNKRRFLYLVSLTSILGCLIPVFVRTNASMIIFLVTAGSLSFAIWEVLSPFINSHIESSERATVLSFFSLSENIAIRFILSPFFGFTFDKSIDLTLILIALLGFVGIIFAMPKNEELS